MTDLSELTLGAKAQFTAQAVATYVDVFPESKEGTFVAARSIREWKSIPCVPTKGIVIGHRTRYSGEYWPGGNGPRDFFSDDWDQPALINRKAVHLVLVVCSLTQEPVFVFPENLTLL